jgi:stage III sporulation protein SpoIIIAA
MGNDQQGSNGHEGCSGQERTQLPSQQSPQSAEKAEQTEGADSCNPRSVRRGALLPATFDTDEKADGEGYAEIQECVHGRTVARIVTGVHARQWYDDRNTCARAVHPHIGDRTVTGTVSETDIVNERTFTDDLHLLIRSLPQSLQDAVAGLPDAPLLEIVMDLGRTPQARLPDQALNLSGEPVTREQLDYVIERTGDFGADNRTGIEGTLHRISAIRNRRGDIVGLTLRVGRAVSGTIDLIRDLVESGDSLLLLGRPGIGKTTKLREIARVLADDLKKRVVVIDTSNEIAGDGDIPHPAIGSARRMQVAHPARQHAVMIEAVENHMPEVIVIDEIGTVEEALAARTIAERGVQLIGTAHGNTLDNLVQNPSLSDLVGGVQTVTLGDEEARFRGTQKTISERKAPPTFDAVVEIVEHDELVIHRNTARAVDNLLRGLDAGGIRRTREGESAVASESMEEGAPEEPREFGADGGGLVRIYPYAISRDSVERVIRALRLEARTVSRPEHADIILALRSRSEDARLRRMSAATGVPIHCVKRNSTAQIRHQLQSLLAPAPAARADEQPVDEAVVEAEQAVQRVLREGVAVELSPRPPALRRAQHRIVTRHRLVAESVGTEPARHLVIYPV